MVQVTTADRQLSEKGYLDTITLPDTLKVGFPQNIEQAKAQIDNIFHTVDSEGKRIEITDIDNKVKLITEEFQRFSALNSPSSDWNKHYALMLFELLTALEYKKRFDMFTPNPHVHELLTKKQIASLYDYEPFNVQLIINEYNKLHLGKKVEKTLSEHIEHPNDTLGRTAFNLAYAGPPNSSVGFLLSGLTADQLKQASAFCHELESWTYPPDSIRPLKK